MKLNLVSDTYITWYGFRLDQYEAELRGNPVSGVQISLEPDGLSTVTDSDGRYRFVALPYLAGERTLTPQFQPPPATRSFTEHHVVRQRPRTQAQDR